MRERAEKAFWKEKMGIPKLGEETRGTWLFGVRVGK